MQTGVLITLFVHVFVLLLKMKISLLVLLSVAAAFPNCENLFCRYELELSYHPLYRNDCLKQKLTNGNPIEIIRLDSHYLQQFSNVDFAVNGTRRSTQRPYQISNPVTVIVPSAITSYRKCTLFGLPHVTVGFQFNAVQVGHT